MSNQPPSTIDIQIPDDPDLLEAEFEEVFERPPDDYDRRLGLARLLSIQRDLFTLPRH